MAFCRWQVGLRGCSTHTPESNSDRQAQVPRQIFGLIEAAFAPPRWMKRDWNGHIRALQHGDAAGAHQCA
jgi:hypothetical protein